MEIKLFNTPVEIGMRCLIALRAMGPAGADLERIMYYDYLSLNTADLNGPESLHPPIPNRGIQVYARKDLISKGLLLLLSKELVDLRPTASGFIYAINASGEKFLEYFQTNYFQALVARIDWTQKEFGAIPNQQIKKYIDTNLQHWGGEFLADKPATP
ncbi:MAG TPA: ABC-three component system middle component 2 [Pedobacter sp.]